MEKRGWHGITPTQAGELDAALSLPHRRGLPYVEATLDVAQEYANRAVAALTGNDLRGALHAAEIWAAAVNASSRTQPPSERLGFILARLKPQ